MTSFSLSSVEKQFLYRKYLKLGNTPETADSKIKDFCFYLKTLKEKLQKRKIPEEDINTRFKREFEKLCRRLDSGEEYLNNINQRSRRNV